MNYQELSELLRSHFTEAFHSRREEGRQEMAAFLADRAGSMDDAYDWLDSLEQEGLLEFVPIDEADAPAMLEAARYGDMPAEGTAPGHWRIGPL